MSHLTETRWHGYETEDRSIELTIESSFDFEDVSTATLRIAGQPPLVLTPEVAASGYLLTADPVTLPATAGVYRWQAEIEDVAGNTPVIVAAGTLSVSPRVAEGAGEAALAGEIIFEHDVTFEGEVIVEQDVIVEGDIVVTGDLDVERPLIFWQHPRNQTIPNEEWTPLAWNTRRNTIGDGWTDFTSPAPSTTIAAGSDAAELPEATIHVADTSDFSASGYLVIEVGGTDRVIFYTGKTATTFTGAQFGVGTLATGQTVRQALVEFTLPTFDDNGVLTALVAEAAFAEDATGSRGMRMFFRAFGLQGAATLIPAAPDVRTHVQIAEQPAEPPGGSSAHRIDVYQSSGGPLNVDVVALGSPRLVAAVVGAWDGTTQNDTD